MCDTKQEIYRLCREQAEIDCALRTLFQEQCILAGNFGHDRYHNDLLAVRKLLKHREDFRALRIFDHLYEEYYTSVEDQRDAAGQYILRRPHPFEPGDYDPEPSEVGEILPRLVLPGVCQHGV